MFALFSAFRKAESRIRSVSLFVAAFPQNASGSTQIAPSAVRSIRDAKEANKPPALFSLPPIAASAKIIGEASWHYHLRRNDTLTRRTGSLSFAVPWSVWEAHSSGGSC